MLVVGRGSHALIYVLVLVRLVAVGFKVNYGANAFSILVSIKALDCFSSETTL